MLHLYLDVCSKPLGTFLSSLCQILKHENVGLFQLTAFPLHFQRKCLVKVLHQTLDVNTFKPLTFNGNRPITVARKAAWKWMHVLSLFFFCLAVNQGSQTYRTGFRDILWLRSVCRQTYYRHAAVMHIWTMFVAQSLRYYLSMNDLCVDEQLARACAVLAILSRTHHLFPV